MLFRFRLFRPTATLGVLGAIICWAAAPAVAQRNVLKLLSAPTRQQLQKGQYAAALPEIDQRLRQDSLNADLLALRAECHLNLQSEAHGAVALADLNKALRLRPNTWLYLAERGFANLQTFHYAESVADLTAALRQTPTDAALLNLRGYGQLSANHLPEAIGDFAQANSLVPREKDYALMLAISQMVAGRDADALRTCDALIGKNKGYNLAYANRALVRHKLHDAAGARQDANEANRLAADSTTQLISAVLHQKAGEAAEAQKLYDELQAKAKDKARFFFERGDLHMQLGDVPAAELDWKQAAQLGNREAVSRLAAGFKPRS